MLTTLYYTPMYCYVHVSCEKYKQLCGGNATDDDWHTFPNLLCSEAEQLNIDTTHELLYDTMKDRLFAFDVPLEDVITEMKEVQTYQETNNITLYWV